MQFSETQLPGALLEAVAQCGYRELTAVQQQVLPAALAGRDIMASAQTGTGKTAAFGLPLLAALIDEWQQQGLAEPEYGAAPRVLILTPTRELAQQVATQLGKYAAHTPFRILAIFGGANFNPQRKAIAAGIEVLVATPGRLFDHLSQDHLRLDQVKALVLDEADRMLDLGFLPDIERLGRYLPTEHQTMLFSATFPEAVKRLGHKLLDRPEWFEVDKQSRTQAQILQKVYPVDYRRKAELLAELIGRNNWQQVLAFVSTKESAEQLQQELKLDGIKSACFHGDKTQGARSRALAQFIDGEIRVLVATDVAARGLDIPALPRVINLELPSQAEDYIHRIGRTGRAGRSGEAISLVSPAEEQKLAEIEALLGYKLPREVLPGYEKGAPLPERYLQPVEKPRHAKTHRGHKPGRKGQAPKGPRRR